VLHQYKEAQYFYISADGLRLIYVDRSCYVHVIITSLTATRATSLLTVDSPHLSAVFTMPLETQQRNMDGRESRVYLISETVFPANHLTNSVLTNTRQIQP